ncbi:MAG: hypothetical protein IJV65_07785 [Kiritimatiellae bacterium]|nr:hypothetical protein [Kiritimatiellia bacterium]
MTDKTPCFSRRLFWRFAFIVLAGIAVWYLPVPYVPVVQGEHQWLYYRPDLDSFEHQKRVAKVMDEYWGRHFFIGNRLFISWQLLLFDKDLLWNYTSKAVLDEDLPACSIPNPAASESHAEPAENAPAAPAPHADSADGAKEPAP